MKKSIPLVYSFVLLVNIFFPGLPIKKELEKEHLDIKTHM